MKTFILFFLSFLIVASTYAQSEDSYLRTAYLGYENGIHKVEVTSKQSCITDIQFQYGVPTAQVEISPNPKNNRKENMVPANGTVVFSITGPASMSIEVRSHTRCNGSSVHPIWLNPLGNVLNIKYTKGNFRVVGVYDRNSKQ